MLIRVSLGSLTPDRFREVCGHLNRCEACTERLELISDVRDPFIESLAGVAQEALIRAKSTMLSESQSGELMLNRLLAQHAALSSDQKTSLLALTIPCQMGPYEVEGLIARGGMGEVYAARHVRLNRPAALKVLRAHRQDDPISQDRFLDEMRSIGQLQHPHLVQAYDAWEEDGKLYLVFERIFGRTLQEVVESNGPMSQNLVVRILIDVCSAMEYAHARGLVHRDLKPANIMITDTGVVKVLDLGLVLLDSSQASRGWHKATVSAVGTLGYMSPEQRFNPTEVDARTDIYSLGCVFEFLIGIQCRTEQGSLISGLPQDLEHVIGKMLAHDREDRYQSMAEVRSALQDVQERLQGTLRTRHRSIQRRFLWLLLLAGALSAVGLVLIPFWWRPSDPLIKSSSHESIKTSTFVRQDMADKLKQPIVKASEFVAMINGRRVERNSIEMLMVEIPSGEFLMGASPSDPDPRPDEYPQRRIEFLQGFFLGQFEVTVGQFRRFVEASGYRTEAEASGRGGWRASRTSSEGTISPTTIWSNPGYPVSDEHPVTLVTYADATAFCHWLSEQEGLTYRLPTEAEWEYACRAGTSGSRYFELTDLAGHCWYLENAAMQARPCGGKHANPWGLFEMNGNVREWCFDWYSAAAYQSVFESQPFGPPLGEKRVIRGGCFIDLATFMQSTHRGYMNADTARNNQGFRVLRELAPLQR